MEENTLVVRAKGGDRDAFALLLTQYEKQVYHHALRMLRHPEDAADAAQEVFLKVWQGLPGFQGGSAFSTCLYRLTDNVCIDLLRREKKRRGDASLDAEGFAAANAVSDPAPSPQQSLERREDRRAVAQALERLSDDHRRVLILRELDGLSYDEIGAILDVPAGTVKSRIARARMALADFLRKSGNFSAGHPSQQ